MSQYKAGDVVLFEWKYAQDPTLSKIRPTVILAHLTDVPETTYQVCAVTSKNQTDRYKGIWVSCQTIKGRQMGIVQDSFINVESLDIVLESNIIKLLGFCPFINDLLDLLDSL